MQPDAQLDRPRTPLQYLRIFLTGFVMGAADIIPGVSGGTIAFIAGIYNALLDAIKSFNLDAIRLVLARKFGEAADHVRLRFLIALGLGILLAVFTLANLLGSLLETHPTYVFALFGGLVVASIVAIIPSIRWATLPIIACIIGAVFAFWLVGLTALNPDSVSHDYLMLFLSGAVAICAMILPGISGSFILLILGQYAFVLGAVRERNLMVLIVFGMGCVVGLGLFSRVLSWLLTHQRSVTLATLVGFMIGSLRRLYMEAATGVETMTAAGNPPSVVTVIILLTIGFVIVTLLDHASSKNNPILKFILK